MTSGVRSSGSSGPAPTHVAAQGLVDREDGRVADRTPGLAQRLGDPVRGELAGVAGEPLADRSTSSGSAGIRPRGAAAVDGQLGEHARGRPAERAAAGADRPEAEVDGLGQAALVGHRGEHRDTGRAAPTSSASMPAARARPAAARRGRRAGAHERVAAATPATVGDDHDQHPVAAGGDLVDQRVGRARQVDHDRVVAAPRRPTSASRTANACSGADARRRTRSAPPAVAPGQRLAQRPGAQPAGGAGQARPSAARREVEPEHPVDARAERVGVDDDGAARRRAATWPSAQANVVAPAPPLPPTTPTASPRAGRGSPRSVSRSTSQPSERGSSATLSAPSASAARNSSSGTGAPGDDVHAVAASRRGARGQLAGEVGPDQHQRRRGPGPQRGRRRRAATSGVTPAAAARRSSSSSRVWSAVTNSGAVMRGDAARARRPRRPRRRRGLWTNAGRAAPVDDSGPRGPDADPRSTTAAHLR